MHPCPNGAPGTYPETLSVMTKRAVVATIRTFLLVASGGLGIGAFCALPDCDSEASYDRMIPGRITLDTGPEQLWRFPQTGDFRSPTLLLETQVPKGVNSCQLGLLNLMLLHPNQLSLDAARASFLPEESLCRFTLPLESGQDSYDLWTRPSPKGSVVQRAEISEALHHSCGFGGLAQLIIVAFLGFSSLMGFALWWHTDSSA